MTTTTIRVNVETRDRLLRTRAKDFAGASIDEVITRLLEEHADHVLRARMRGDAEHARTNSADINEIRRVHAELDEISAW